MRRIKWIAIVGVLLIVAAVGVRFWMASRANSKDGSAEDDRTFTVNGERYDSYNITSDVAFDKKGELKRDEDGYLLNTKGERIVKNSDAKLGTKDNPVVKVQSVTLGAVENPLIVLEIVPHESIGFFGYLLEGCEPIDMDKLVSTNTWDYPMMDSGVATVGWVEGRNQYIHNHKLADALFVDKGREAKVIVATPNVFSDYNNLDMIKMADLIYVHRSTGYESKMIDAWLKYNKEEKLLEDNAGETLYNKSSSFGACDLPWRAVLAIVERMASENPAAFVGLGNIIKDDKNTNAYKLAIILYEYSSKVFCERYRIPDAFEKVDGTYAEWDDSEIHPENYDIVTTGSGVKTGVLYRGGYHADAEGVENWDSKTLWPYPDRSSDYEDNVILKHYGDWGNWANGKNISEGSSLEDNTFFYMSTAFGYYYLREWMVQYDDNKVAFAWYQTEDGKDREKYPDGAPRRQSLTTNDIVVFLLREFRYPTKKPSSEEDSVTYKDSGLKVLEIQPCNKFIYNTEGWQDQYREFFPGMTDEYMNNKATFDVTTMPTWEFIANIDDLNAEYDAIIIGTEQNKSNGLGGYRDKRLNNKDGGGLIYTSVGDLVTDDRYVQTLPDDGTILTGDPDTMRYSGNDITEKKLNELVRFMEGGKPVILDRSFVDDGTAIRTDIVDKSSYMYKFAKLYDANKHTPNLFVRGLMESEKLQALLTTDLCEMELKERPAQYAYTAQNVDGASGVIGQNSVNYVQGTTFRYVFKIKGNEKNTYAVKLFVDMDGDGIYDGSQKELSGEMEGIGEEVPDLIVKPVGSMNAVDSDKLQPDVEYELTRDMADYYGVMPWKLEVTQVGNEQCRDNEIGYSVLEHKDASGNKVKTKIKVLQMCLTPDMSDNEVYFAGKENRVINYYNLATEEKNPVSQTLKKYLDCLDDYDVTIEFLKNSDWYKQFGVATGNSVSTAEKKEKIAAWKEYLNQYDMLMLGFHDDCTYTNDEVFHAGFTDFVEQGKGVILSHDMVHDTSRIPLLKTNYDEYLRQLLYQRRYTVSSVSAAGTSVDLLYHDDLTLGLTSGQPTELKVIQRKLREDKDFTFSYNVQDDSVTDKKGKKVTMPGVLDNAAKLYVLYADQSQDGKADRSTRQQEFPGVTTWISLANGGQITQYPYLFSGKAAEVAGTHMQCYQLDMERDAVVWYNLTNANSSTVGEYIKNSGNGSWYEWWKTGLTDQLQHVDDDLYSSRENDGRNNFYLYNAGNITYTGFGHSSETLEMPHADEFRLFVNTIISAYRAIPARPKVDVTNDDSIITPYEDEDGNLGQEVVVYSIVDENIATSEQGTTVNFKINDPSIGDTKGRVYALELKDSKGNVVAFYKQDDKAEVTEEGILPGYKKVVRDGQYCFDVPLSTIQKDGTAEYTMVLYSVCKGPKGEELKTTHTTKIQVMQMPLFMLN